MVELWTSDPTILFTKSNMKYFVPTSDQTYAEKINSATRFLIYGSILLFLIRGDANIFFIPILAMLVLFFLIKWGYDIPEIREKFEDKKSISECIVPSINNPFMNVMPTDKPSRLPACDYTQTTKDKIDNVFGANLYLDTNDIYSNRNSQRQFYTMPSTSTPNAQGDFASWLYGDTSTFKSKNIVN
tara:strand:+ start:800 stop:1357 length:558 start_codon:yes stop_codon:yes gene_type:complete